MNINSSAKKVIELLESKGYEAYVVGGCVRDMLLDREPNDWDITTNALPEQMLKIFEGYHVIPTGLKHGTITILIDEEAFEVTTYRIDGEYSDCRRPDSVEFTSSIVEDLARRDFTINAIAYNPITGFIDPFGGQMDLLNNKIKAVGDPNLRFREDALRMMRCVRFACQLDWDIDVKTYYSLDDNIVLINQISIERIREELNKILISDSPVRGINILLSSGLLNTILPEVRELKGFDQYNPNHFKDVYGHTMLVLDSIPNSLTLRWSALLHDVGKPATFSQGEDGVGHFYEHHKIGADIARDILRRLKFDNDTIEKVGILVYNHMSRFDFVRDASIKKFINRVGVENLDDLFELQIADIKGSKPPHDFKSVEKLCEEVNRILNEKQPLTVKDLAVNGNDLIDLGFKPSKELGNVLKLLMEEVLKNPELNNKQTLIELITK